MREITLKEFKKNIQRVNETRNHTIKNSLGIRDAFLFLQRNKWFNIGRSLKEHEFQQIIRQINNLLAFQIMEGHEVIFPQKMGSLEPRKFSTGAKIVDGKVIPPKTVDWDKTLELWYNDEEAYKAQTLVRSTATEGLSILYNRENANYNNKMFYQFVLNREVKRLTSKHFKQGRIEAYL